MFWTQRILGLRKFLPENVTSFTCHFCMIYYIFDTISNHQMWWSRLLWFNLFYYKCREIKYSYHIISVWVASLVLDFKNLCPKMLHLSPATSVWVVSLVLDLENFCPKMLHLSPATSVWFRSYGLDWNVCVNFHVCMCWVPCFGFREL